MTDKYNTFVPPDIDEEESGSPRFMSTPTSSNKPSTTLSSPLIVGTAIFSLVALSVLLSSSSSSSESFLKSVSNKSLKDVKKSSKVNFTLKRRGYDALPYFNSEYDSPLKYAFLKGYAAVIEPSTPMDLHYYDDTTEGHSYEYSVCKEETCQTGVLKNTGGNVEVKSVKVACSPHDDYTLTVTEYDASNTLVGTSTKKAMCLYVRREIRSLTSSDLEAVLKASVTLNSVSDAEGEKKYGGNYKSALYLSKFHFYNAAQKDQDHIHEGNGFLTQHLKLTSIFEKSIQSIDPSVAVPYWDYTIDQSEGLYGYNSYVSQESVYGGVTQAKKLSKGFTYTDDKIVDGAIQSGYWAKTEVEDNLYYPDLSYAYGYMRSPWNFNPSPYISRFGFQFSGALSFPTCSSHYTILQYTDMMDFFDAIAFGPHGTTHTVMAGFFGCDSFDSLVSGGYIKGDSTNMCSLWSYIIKDLWRYNYLSPNKDCVVEEPLESSYCGYSCVESDKASLVKYIKMMGGSSVSSTNSDYEDVWYDFVCGGEGGKVFTGDHLESASPGDPSFWAIHPTIERLFHAKLMTNSFDSEKWATDTLKDYVCDFSYCRDEDTDEMGRWDSCCYGHFEHDRLYDATVGSRDKTIGPTNAEVLASADPRSDDYSLDYIFDKFEWNHCDDDFDTLISDLAAANQKTASSGANNKARSMPQEQIALREMRSMRMQRNKDMAELRNTDLKKYGQKLVPNKLYVQKQAELKAKKAKQESNNKASAGNKNAAETSSSK